MLSMREYSPECSVWINNRKLELTDAEVVNYQANVSAVMERENRKRSQDTVVEEDEPQDVEDQVPKIPQSEQRSDSMLLDPTMFESDVDI